MAKPLPIRACAAQLLYQVVDQGHSLAALLDPAQRNYPDPRDRALLQTLCFGVLRDLPRLEACAKQLFSKPLVKGKRVLHFLALSGFYQLAAMRIPDHAAVGATVQAASSLGGNNLKGLLNGVLRNFQRQQQSLLATDDDNPVLQWGHPGWLIRRLQQAYPQQWQAILDANNQQAPIWLRPNCQQISCDDYSQALTAAEIDHQRIDDAILLQQAVQVPMLPGFEQGQLSVQDGAAQQAAVLLDAQVGERILDACAAPGGKTAHLLELTPELGELIALDIDHKRVERIAQNLERLQLHATLVEGDATKQDWWDGRPFDRILLDAPCSATGVIRKHPDIRWLRRDSDIDALARLQQQILNRCWQLLKPGGTLLYATCSVLPEENQQQISAFLAEHADAEECPITLSVGHKASHGWQIVPGEQQMDGFYYAKLRKAN